MAAADWENLTPCEGWVARDIVQHMVVWMPSVLGGSGLAISSGPSVEVDAAGTWQHLSDQLQAMLDDPATAAIEFDVGPPGRMTVENTIGMLMMGDVLIHTWDLARATNQDDRIDEEIAGEMLIGMQPMDEMLRQSGHYGAKIAVTDDARVQDRLMGFLGRDPAWRS